MFLEDIQVYKPSANGPYTTIQAAIAAAAANSPVGTVIIPAGYAGTDTYTNAGNVSVLDFRTAATATGLNVGGKTLGGVLSVLNAQTAITTISAAQSMVSVTLPAGVQNAVGKTLRVRAYGVFSQPGTTASVPTFSVLLGGVTPISIAGASSTAAITNGQFQLEFLLTTATAGAAGTLEAHGVALVQGAATNATALPVVADTNTAVSAAINLTVANSLAIQIAVATTAWTSLTLRQATIELLN